MAKNLAVDESRCVGCGACMSRCPVDAIEMREGKAHITDRCQLCLQCAEECEAGAL